MIAVDTSALVAILLDEDDSDYYLNVLERVEVATVSAATVVELNAVMTRRLGAGGLDIVRELLQDLAIAIHPFTETQAQIASEAYHRFPALNFGDCFSYALAKELDVPLLYKGDDFGRTDLRKA